MRRIALIFLLVFVLLIVGCTAPSPKGHDALEEAAAGHPRWIQCEWWQEHPVATAAGSSAILVAYIAMLFTGVVSFWAG